MQTLGPTCTRCPRTCISTRRAWRFRRRLLLEKLCFQSPQGCGWVAVVRNKPVRVQRWACPPCCRYWASGTGSHGRWPVRPAGWTPLLHPPRSSLQTPGAAPRISPHDIPASTSCPSEQASEMKCSCLMYICNIAHV